MAVQHSATPPAEMPTIDFADPERYGFARYEILARYRDSEPPIARDQTGAVHLFSYDDCFRVAVDVDSYRSFGNEFALAIGCSEDGGFGRWQEHAMIAIDPPRHTEVRRTVPHFSKHRLKGLLPAIRATCHELVDEFPEDGVIDFIDAFAFKLPVGVIMRILHLPREDEADIRRWSSDAIPADLSPASIATSDAANDHLREYAEGAMEERRRAPIADEPISDLVAALDRGEITHEEAWAQIVLLIVGGHDTSMAGLSCGLYTLMRHRDQSEALRADPSLLPNAVAEMLRYEAPSGSIVRVASVPVEHHGHAFDPGQIFVLQLSGANRDPRKFPDPDRFDIRRSNARQHVAFGGGPHRCLGASMAQVEIEIAFGVLLERLESFEPAGESTLRVPAVFRNFDSLPVHVRRRT